MTRLEVNVGRTEFKNPLICGSGEHVIQPRSLQTALKAGVGAVVAKSANESAAASEQLERAEYLLLDDNWRPLPWDRKAPRNAHLLSRSGLAPQPVEAWIEDVATADRSARNHDAYVIASLIPADLDRCVSLARQVEQAGIRILELNIGAPHGDEAQPGAILKERDVQRVESITRRIRDTVSIPLWIKLTGETDKLTDLAAAASAGGADAVVMTGRFMALLPDVDTMQPFLGTRAAIGGRWALPLTCRWLAMTRSVLGTDYPLVGTNGARDGLDIARMMLAGAHAVEMTSAVWIGGFEVLGAALEELERYLAEQQSDARSLIGRSADQATGYEYEPERRGQWRNVVPPE